MCQICPTRKGSNYEKTADAISGEVGWVLATLRCSGLFTESLHRAVNNTKSCSLFRVLKHQRETKTNAQSEKQNLAIYLLAGITPEDSIAQHLVWSHNFYLSGCC